MVHRYLLIPAGLIFFLALLPGDLIPDGGVVLSKTAASITSQEQSNPGHPIRLKIPTIGIDATVTPVGLTSIGVMDAPKNPAEVGWLSVGTIPGEKGTAVMAGHFGWKNDIPAVFDTLHTLQQGDTLVVEDENGKLTTFIVRKVRVYDQKEDTSAVFGSSDEKAHLSLITCEGVWDRIAKTYAGRLVVFADGK